MKWCALGCAVFLMGAWFGFYEAHAASGIRYTGFMVGKDVPSQSAEFLKGYAAGTFDSYEWATWVANEHPKDFTAETFTNYYQCLQKIPTAADIVAWAKDYWAKQPDYFASPTIFVNACDYKPSASANTIRKGQGPAHTRTGKNTIIK